MKPILNPDMLLSEHFKLSEFLASRTAEEKDIPNVPLKCHITALQNLAVRCLEPTRQHFGLPIQITSGYRCPKLNEAVKGAPTSQHIKGEAADITIPRKHWPFSWMKSNIDLDQLILEHKGSAWWVHVSCRVNHRKNRHQKLMIENGKTIVIE